MPIYDRPSRRRMLVFVATTLVTSVMVAPWSGGASAQTRPVTAVHANLDGTYPDGVPDSSEPSGEAPPSAVALAGYTLSYETDFDGTAVPSGWNVFTGIPGGDPGGHFGASHVVVNDGVLALDTFRDPAWHNRWVTGGICQCGVAQVYGAYFVRSRLSGAGPTQVELLWPQNNAWPPEIDFNETGGSATSTTTSIHFGSKNHIVHHSIKIDMTQWHTWGVIWAPHDVTFTVDGRVWESVRDTAVIPTVSMTLDFESRQECEEHRQCPTAPESMLVDWVAEYASNQ